MNLPKAKKILEDIIHYVEPGDPPEEHKAIKVGIEAIERLEVGRNNPGTFWNDPLPSESED